MSKRKTQRCMSLHHIDIRLLSTCAIPYFRQTRQYLIGRDKTLCIVYTHIVHGNLDLFSIEYAQIKALEPELAKQE